MKQLKFRSEWVPMILSGEKTTTWRMFDDKQLTTMDKVEFVDRGTGEVFAKGRLIWVEEKKFKDIGDSDNYGHETNLHGEDLYKFYGELYNQPVDGETLVKIVKFELIP